MRSSGSQLGRRIAPERKGLRILVRSQIIYGVREVIDIGEGKGRLDLDSLLTEPALIS